MRDFFVKLQSDIHNTKSIAIHLKDLLGLVVKHQAYRTLHKENGEVFKSIEEFCAEKQPWGLEYEKEALDQIIQERINRQRRLNIEGVPEDGRVDRERDVNTGRFQQNLHHSYQDDKNGVSSSESMARSRLRAIKERAPTIVR